MCEYVCGFICVGEKLHLQSKSPIANFEPLLLKMKKILKIEC